MGQIKKKAIFLDRDGVILKMVYDLESGYIHTALHPKHVNLVEGIIPLFKKAKKLKYKLIIISNQPNIGLGRISKENFEKVRLRMHQLLSKKGIVLEGEYYCMHHPYASISKYRKECQCRKPKTGLFIQASKDFNIDLKKSWVIGDGVYDIIAGYTVECKTILVGNLMEAEYLRILEEKLGTIKPTFLVKNIKEIKNLLTN